MRRPASDDSKACALQTDTPNPCFAAIAVSASTTFLLHQPQRRISRHDFRSPIGVAGVGRAVYGNSGISLGQPQLIGPDDDQAG
jgi:hypothetical protein